MTWALQAYKPAQDIAYIGIPEEPAQPSVPKGQKPPPAPIVATLGDDYQNAAAPVVRTQIARAGVRLANALKTALP